jgi:predicted RNase H-like nuclease (RuvC/YqgF family)
MTSEKTHCPICYQLKRAEEIEKHIHHCKAMSPAVLSKFPTDEKLTMKVPDSSSSSSEQTEEEEEGNTTTEDNTSFKEKYEEERKRREDLENELLRMKKDLSERVVSIET